MKSNDTKQRIMETALTLFSTRGYQAVSVQEIASAIHIKAPSLYKHYASKQAIFDAILNEMDERYKMQAQSLSLDGIHPQNDVDHYNEINQDTLIAMSMQLFQYFLHDDFALKFRKMLTIEQYHNPQLASMYMKQFIEDPIRYQSGLFQLLMQHGNFIQTDPTIMAYHFYSPIYLMLNSCSCDASKESQAIQILEQHIKQFIQLYGVKKK